MDPLSEFLSSSFIMLCLAITGILLIIRLPVDYTLSNTTLIKWWRNVVLPILPVVMGIVFGWLVKGYYYPSDIISSSSRIIFGTAAGLCSTQLYRMVIALLNNKEQSIYPSFVPGVPTYTAPLPQNNTITTTPATITTTTTVNPVPNSPTLPDTNGGDSSGGMSGGFQP